MTLRQRSGFLILIFLIIATELIIQFYPFDSTYEKQEFTSEELAIAKNSWKENTGNDENQEDVVYFDFNPNALDEKGFMQLGFSDKQAKSIIKYRYIVGGNFASIQEFGESYVISDQKLKELTPYIKLKKVETSHTSQQKTWNTAQNQKIKLAPFDLNQQSAADFFQLGFSEKQTQTILNFKNSLPNHRFSTAEQFHQSYGVNDYMFNRLKPYIIINKKSPTVTKPKSLAINKASIDDFIAFGFSASEASNIIKYRDFIGGFKNLAEIDSCEYISDKMYHHIKEQLTFETN